MWILICALLLYLAAWLWLWGEVKRGKMVFQYISTAKWVGVIEDKNGRVVFIQIFPCCCFAVLKAYAEFTRRNPNVVA